MMAHFNFNFEVIDGFGKILASNLSNWLNNNFDLLTPSPEVDVYNIIRLTDELPRNSGTILTDKCICITGKLNHFANRQELVAKIESLGGKWVDSVSSKTSYLINNDKESTSGKNKKAQSLNVPIISEEDFLKLIGEA